MKAGHRNFVFIIIWTGRQDLPRGKKQNPQFREIAAAEKGLMEP